MKKFIFLIALTFTAGAFAQDQMKSSLRVKLGDDEFKEGNYYEAIRYYLAAIDENKDNVKAQYQLAECYRLTQQYEDAAYYYDMVTSRGHDPRYPLAGFYRAMMQKMKGQYDAAMKNFAEFRSLLVENNLHESEKFRDYYKQAKLEIDGCELALKQMSMVHPDYQFQPLSAPLNSEYNEYAAFGISDDGVVCLTTTRGDKNSLKDPQFGEYFADLLRFINRGGSWSPYDPGDRFEKAINTKYGDGSGAFNRERNKFYYTKCDEEGGVCHIYLSRLEGGRWSEPVALNHNINEYGINSKHPSVTPGGDTLYFASDREGGMGELDIYMSISSGNDNWGPAIHLGNQINTPFNEISPCYDADQRVLFFASNGHMGFGGYDIYLARGANLESAEIYNAGIPFNSHRDDIFFYLGNKNGYVSSNREEGPGGFDIYAFSIPSKSNVIADVSNEGTVAGRNSLFTDDYNFDSNETEIINQIISRMLSSSVSDVDLILTDRQLAVYNALSADDKERIDRIVKARVRKMTSNLIRSIRTEDDYYYQQLSADKRRKVDNIVTTYLEQQGLGNSVKMSNDVFGFYSAVDSDEREKIDVFISEKLKSAQAYRPATPTYNKFTPKDQQSIDGIALKYLKQKKNLESIALDMNEKVLLRDNKDNIEEVNDAVKERLIGLSNEEKYRILKEDKDFYESLSDEEKEKLKSIASTFMTSDLTNLDQNIRNSDLEVYKNRNTQEQSRLDKLLLKQISNLANSSIYLTENTFSAEEIQSSLGDTPEETVNRLLSLRPGLSTEQKKAVERFVKSAYESYMAAAEPVFRDPAAIATVSEDYQLTTADINKYKSLSATKRRIIDNLIALDYLREKYGDRAVKLRDEFKKSELSGKEKVYIAALVKKISGNVISNQEEPYVNDAFAYYNELPNDRKGLISRLVLDQILDKESGQYTIPGDENMNAQLSPEERTLMEKLKRSRFQDHAVLTSDIRIDSREAGAIDLLAMAAQENLDHSGAEKLLGAEDILASEETDEIRIGLPINKIEGYDEIIISGRLVGSNSGSPLASYPIKLIAFDNNNTVIEGYTNRAGEFRFTVLPAKYDLTFKKANSAENVNLEDFAVEGKRTKTTTLVTSATRAFFDVDASELRPEVKILLDEVAAAFKEKGGVKIEIESHTDATGSAEYNLDLSKKRGYAARNYLMLKGIDKSDISVIWHGSENPIADNDSPFGRQLNRRIDVRIIGKDAQDFGQFYLVRSGTTLQRLAGSLNLSEEEIKAINGLDGELKAYQPIRLKTTGSLQVNDDLLVSAEISDNSDFVYFAKPGDTLESIANKFNIPEEIIMEQNNLRPGTLKAGQRIIIYKRN